MKRNIYNLFGWIIIVWGLTVNHWRERISEGSESMTQPITSEQTADYIERVRLANRVQELEDELAQLKANRPEMKPLSAKIDGRFQRVNTISVDVDFGDGTSLGVFIAERGVVFTPWINTSRCGMRSFRESFREIYDRISDFRTINQGAD